MDGKLLDTEKIFSGRDLAWDSDRVCSYRNISIECKKLLTLYSPLKSHTACPELKSGPISLILNQSLEPSAAVALSTLVI